MLTLYKISNLIFQIVYFLLLIRVLLSWIPHDRSHPIVYHLYNITEPILAPFRNIISPYKTGGLDISPIFAFIALSILQKIVNELLFAF